MLTVVITAIDKEELAAIAHGDARAHLAYVKETGAVRLGGPFLNAQAARWPGA